MQPGVDEHTGPALASPCVLKRLGQEGQKGRGCQEIGTCVFMSGAVQAAPLPVRQCTGSSAEGVHQCTRSSAAGVGFGCCRTTRYSAPRWRVGECQTRLPLQVPVLLESVWV
eukprot:scaffold54672_cov21-Tisochrysis_lutea.AAC.2